MALTNYGILLCKGVSETVENTTTITFDVTQGEVLDALKAGALVVLNFIGDTDPAEEHFIFYINAYGISGNEVVAYANTEMEFSLNDPDALLVHTIEND